MNPLTSIPAAIIGGGVLAVLCVGSAGHGLPF